MDINTLVSSISVGGINPQLKLAVLWAEKSVKKDESYANTDTLANLYFKVGEKDNAKSMAEQAIKLAEKAGEDAASTKELLKKLQ